MKDSDRNKKLNVLFFIVGSICLVLGISLILIWWSDVVSIFRGGAALVLALGGLYVLYAADK